MKKLAQLRGSKNWTQEELAEVSGVTRQTIISLETGKVKKPQMETIINLARAFEMPIEEFERWIT